MEFENKVFSFAEVSVHNSAKDCWVIVNAKAYDVTNFLVDHPGGDEVLLAAAGKDASEEFEEVGHGSAARLMLDEFYVGEVDPLTVPPQAASQKVPLKQQPAHREDNSSSTAVTKMLLLVAIAILGLAVGIHYNYYSQGMPH